MKWIQASVWRSFKLVLTKITMSKFIILCRHCHLQSLFSSSVTHTDKRIFGANESSWLMFIEMHFHHQCRIHCSELIPNNLLKTSIQYFILYYYHHYTNKYNVTYFATVDIFYSRFSEEKVHKISFSYWTNKVWRWNTILKKKMIFIIEYLWLSISENHKKKTFFEK